MATPENKNFLNPQGFRFTIQRLPHVSYFCTTSNIPSLSIDRVNQPSPFLIIPRPGTKTSFAELSLTFKIDEDMKNYIEIVDWMFLLANPITFREEGEKLYSDASLVITTSNYNPNINMKYVDIWPTSLGAPEFSIGATDIEPMVANVTFAIRNYTLTPFA